VLSRSVDKISKGPGVIVSRAAPELVQHLFQTEVPEIYDGTVVIRAIAREAGERTKIAVMSKDKDVDPVGACVGMKGMRVQSIIRELRGEKIDIIEYHEDAVTFAEKALQPAKVSRVTVVDSADKHLEVIVDDTQLSLAIGKKGQNVRLAAKLLGWKIDIKSEEEKRQEVEQQMQALVGTNTPLDKVSELEESVIDKLIAGGVTSVEGLADMTPEQLEAIPGIGPRTIEKISIAVSNYFQALEAGEAAAAPVAPDGAELVAQEGVVAGSEPAPDAETSAEAEAAPPEMATDLPEGGDFGVTPADDAGPDSAGQAGDTLGLSQIADAESESVSELAEEGQSMEAAVVQGVEDAPDADEAEVTTHEQHPEEKQIPPEKQ